jgi:CBS-domain-containing membrane protein
VAILDEKFKARKGRYVLQCGMAACVVFVVLLVLDAVAQTAIIASLGASAFIAFAMPRANTSGPRFLIVGYLIGTVVGCGCYYLSTLPVFAQSPDLQGQARIVFGALSVGLAILLMVVMNAEHPPAAGRALGFVLNEWNFWTVIVVVFGIVLLSILKTILKPVLVDLL